MACAEWLQALKLLILTELTPARRIGATANDPEVQRSCITFCNDSASPQFGGWSERD
jgi:hypothetical protein